MSTAPDKREVVLLKSERTGNRFYTLVPPDSQYENSGTIPDFPAEFPLGIAYPCLEDGLNDFAVIRTTFETIEMIGDDAELRTEMMSMIDEARAKLVLRLEELRDRLASGQVHFLGTELHEFRSAALAMATKGSIRKTLDNMMKLDVFESVARVEAERNGRASNPMYHYEFLPHNDLRRCEHLADREFVARVFDDVLGSVMDDRHYTGRYDFDHYVFQKFIAVMFVNYATTDPQFYGTSRADYGVSSSKDMRATPLYQAVAGALRDLETRYRPGEPEVILEPLVPVPTTAPADEPVDDLSHLFAEEDLALDDLDAALSTPDFGPELAPFGRTDSEILELFAQMREGALLIRQWQHPRAEESSRLIVGAARALFRFLQKNEVLSPLASDPLAELNNGQARASDDPSAGA